MLRVIPICSIAIFLFSFKVGAQTSALAVADSLYALGNYTAAINQYAKVDSPMSSIQIARSYNAIGNYEKAIAQYQATLQSHPELSIAQFELGKLLLKTKNKDAALVAFNALINQKQENPEYYYYLGRTLETQMNQVKANQAFRKAVQLDSTHLRSLYSLGKYFVGQEIRDSALVYIDQGLRFYENDVAMINLKAQAYYNNGQFKLAIPHFERLMELGETQPFVLKRVAFCYFRAYKNEEAIKTYQMLAMDPWSVADAYSGLGDVYFQEKQLDSAQFYIEKSIEERTEIFDQEYADLGRIARIQGKTKQAMDLYTKAWEENKDNYYNYYQVCILADEYFKDPETRLAYYERLLHLYPDAAPFIAERVKKRISEIKEEIHMARN
ncbi:tetratricopeptide repeat protein [Flagellimonas zhangzhouensis]|uniref:Tetratricopeptide repeat-containing protein n=1 Tax=Flagellimonas zhangzhouensis TaxID=1073328 RepID=A0A1H2WNV1_9FLAO|nr:tetratricopeptide repeat protein [Allomuricauda zhangzhouensis]SDQ23189.1 Tetratricopeptide repeat-containing protein [Allomuricauda zhangzhouensis]SDW82271.1 Tetratricopeptide repeat-containing protein [Allomuricauda zhangzhouensis]